MHLVILTILAAVLLDFLLGDPVYCLHPVRLMGKLIEYGEKMARRMFASELPAGAALLIGVWLVIVLVYAGSRWLLAQFLPLAAIIFDGFLIYSCIALGDLFAHSTPIAKALQQGDIAAARRLVQRIVGRDASVLDQEGVARATVESVAESFVDGFLAPLFWYTAVAICTVAVSQAYLPVATAAVLLYRATNTMDSMVGYKNQKYIRFGKVAARTDDVLNFVPARLALLVLLVAAAVQKSDWRRGWRIAMRDRRKHASPNSAHAESFVAGSLGIRLGGPTKYRHGTVDKPWLGDGTAAVDENTVLQANELILNAGWLSLLMTTTALLITELLIR